MVQAILMETNRFVLKSTTGSSRINNIMVLMPDYIRWANFITKPCLYSLGVGIFSNSIALGIHLWKPLQLYSFKTRLGGKICSTDVNMH